MTSFLASLPRRKQSLSGFGSTEFSAAGMFPRDLKMV
jgi:hypothetical protein